MYKSLRLQTVDEKKKKKKTPLQCDQKILSSGIRQWDRYHKEKILYPDFRFC
jgi:hypothetical protein